MVSHELLWVDRIRFKLVLAEQWAHEWYMRHIFFGKNWANTETHSFADAYVIRILDEGNNHFSAALL